MSDSHGGLYRERFPILKSRTYLASHSLGAVCEATGLALQEYYNDWATLGVDAWDGPFWKAVTDFQALLGRMLDWPRDSICPLQNATRGMAALASALDYQTPRRRILVSALEFTTAYPFWQAQEDLGAKVVIVPSPDGRHVPLENFVEALDERTLLVVCSHAYFRSGHLAPELKELSRAVHCVGARLLLDTYQSLGSVVLNATEAGVDAVVGGCHKWLCGGPGAGFLALAPDYWPTLKPRLTGWFGLQNPFSYQKDLGRGEPHASALRFLAGTPNVPALYAARPALQLILEIGRETIRETSMDLTEGLRRDLEERGLTIHSPSDPKKRNGMLCIEAPQNISGPDLVSRLRNKGYVTDWRPDCGLRVSPHFYNTSDELRHFAETFAALVRA